MNKKKEVKLDNLTNLEKHTTRNPINRFFLDNFLRAVVRTIKPLNISSILDVGCGEGFTLATLKKEGIGKKLEGVDYVENALEIGKKLYPDLVLKKGDIYRLQYKADSFDLVLCTEVLEHLAEPEKGLRELVRVSKKYALVTVPNEPWFTFQRIARGKNLLKLGAHPEHIQWWTAGSFEAFVKKEKNVRLVLKKLPFPWTMVLLEKKN